MKKIRTVAGLELGNGYKLNRILKVAKDELHIPYRVGCIIIGPKGGKYTLDEFGVQMLLRANEKVQSAFSEMAKHTNVIYGDKIFSSDGGRLNTNEKVMTEFSRINGFTFIKRTEVNKFISKVVG